MKTKPTKAMQRRKFLGTSTLAAAGLTLGAGQLFAGPAILRQTGDSASDIRGVKIGLITYSFRSMPDQSAEAILSYIRDCGITAVELMGDPAESFAGKPENPIDRRAFYTLRRASRSGNLSDTQKREMAEMQAAINAYNAEVAEWRSKTPMAPFEKLRKMFADAGISIYAFKPRAFGQDNTDAEINWGMKAARALGASHVTLEHPGDDAHTGKLGRMGAKNGVFVAYHGHEQQTPTFWDTALRQSTMNALNLDLGHYVAAGNANPLDIIRRKHYRIRSMHLKDRQSPENGKGNLPWGSGDTPLAEALQLMRDEGYEFPATIELEYEIPEGSNAVTEVRKCLDYCRGVLG